jgi:hypothetical protein
VTQDNKADLLGELAKRLEKHKQAVAQRSCLSNLSPFSRWIVDEGHSGGRVGDFDCLGNVTEGIFSVSSIVLASTSVLGSRQGKQGGRSISQESSYPGDALPSLAVARASRAGAVYARNTPIRPATARRSIFSSVSFSTGGFPLGTFSFDMQNLPSAVEQLL